MSRTMDGSASGFRSKLHSRAESFSLENLGIRSGKSGQESLQGSRRIRIGIKLQSRAESLSLESLDRRSGMSTHESRQGWRRIRI